MGFAFRRWIDFGAEGVAPESVELEYAAEATYSLPADDISILENTWNSLVDSSDGLHDAPGFNVLGATDTTIQLGPTQFRDYYLRRLAISDDPRFDSGRLSDRGRQVLVESVHLLSSFVAVIADDHLTLGIKPPRDDRGSFLSFPGSGYLDRDYDMENGDVAPTTSLVNRELREELHVTADPERIRCLGVFEDVNPASHLNPALFSIVSLEESPASLREAAREAPDIDEFQQLVFLPVVAETIDALVELGIEGTVSSTLEEFPVERFDGMSHKSLLMLLLLGRREIGEEWFDRTVTAYPDLTVDSSCARSSTQDSTNSKNVS